MESDYRIMSGKLFFLFRIVYAFALLVMTALAVPASVMSADLERAHSKKVASYKRCASY
jgi:hypothetical protein